MPSDFPAIKPLFRLLFIAGLCPLTIKTNSDSNQSSITFSTVSFFYSAAPIMLIFIINIYSVYGIVCIYYFLPNDNYFYRNKNNINRYSDFIAIFLSYMNFSIFFLLSIKNRKIHCHYLNRCIESKFLIYPITRPKTNYGKILWCNVVVIALYFWTNFVHFQLLSPNSGIWKTYYLTFLFGYTLQYQSIVIFVAYIRFLVMCICEHSHKVQNLRNRNESVAFDNTRLWRYFKGLNEYLRQKHIFEKSFASQIIGIAVHVVLSITSMTFSIGMRRHQNLSAMEYNSSDLLEHVFMPVIMILVLVWTLERFGMQVICFLIVDRILRILTIFIWSLCSTVIIVAQR